MLVTAEYPPMPGGVGDYTARLAAGLAAAGAQPVVVTSRAGADSGGAHAPEDGVPVWRSVSAWGWRMPRTIEQASARHRPDVVHIQYQTGAYAMHPAINTLPWWLRRQRRRPALAVTFHDTRTPYLAPRIGRLRQAATATLARGCDLTVATTPPDANHLRRWARRLALIPIGANIEPDAGTAQVAADLRATLDLAEGEHLIVTFGLLTQGKGLPVLLRALARLNAASAAGRYRLVVVGAGDVGSDATDRATAAALRQLATDLQVAMQITWTGWQPPALVAGWLRAADAVALPYADGASYRRGSLLAALACGAAVVTTTPVANHADAAAGLPPLRSGVHVSLVAPDDAAGLAFALAATCGDQWLNRSLRDAGQALARQFAWPTIVERHLIEYLALRPASVGRTARSEP